MKYARVVEAPADVRNQLGLNQTVFWSRVGVGQSAGSRYESGRKLPRPIKALLTICYGTDRQAEAAVKELRGGAQ